MAISFKETLDQGFQDFWSKKVRSLVTVIGIVLGTASIILVMSIVEGATRDSVKFMEQNGGINMSNLCLNREFDGEVTRPKFVSFKEINEIIRPIAGVKHIKMSYNFGAFKPISYNDKEVSPWFVAANLDYINLEKMFVSEGRTISKYDIEHKTKVCIIGTNVRTNLFGSENPVGKKIKINDDFYEVIGLMKKKEFYSNGDAIRENWLEWMNKMIIIPITTGTSLYPKYYGRETNVDVYGINKEVMKYLPQKIAKTVNELFDSKPVYKANSAIENIEKMNKDKKKFVLIFYFISGISLIVGGVVIMNIMLATIKERTREIGIRMSIGGSRRDIFMQFLIQTVLVTTIGGVLGVIVGSLASSQLSAFLGMSAAVNIRLILVAIGTSAGIGIIFGILPSWKACSLDPVQALRNE